LIVPHDVNICGHSQMSGSLFPDLSNNLKSHKKSRLYRIFQSDPVPTYLADKKRCPNLAQELSPWQSPAFPKKYLSRSHDILLLPDGRTTLPCRMPNPTILPREFEIAPPFC